MKSIAYNAKNASNCRRSVRGATLLDAVHRYYLIKTSKRSAKVSMQFHHNGTNIEKIWAMRILRRYFPKTEKVVLNVARGEFPEGVCF